MSEFPWRIAVGCGLILLAAGVIAAPVAVLLGKGADRGWSGWVVVPIALVWVMVAGLILYWVTDSLGLLR